MVLSLVFGSSQGSFESRGTTRIKSAFGEEIKKEERKKGSETLNEKLKSNMDKYEKHLQSKIGYNPAKNYAAAAGGKRKVNEGSNKVILERLR